MTSFLLALAGAWIAGAGFIFTLVYLRLNGRMPSSPMGWLALVALSLTGGWIWLLVCFGYWLFGYPFFITDIGNLRSNEP